MFLFMWWFASFLRPSESTVFDPALYLSPSPPLTPIQGSEILWAQSLKQMPNVVNTANTDIENELVSTKLEKEAMQGEETFWPRITSSYGFQSFPIHFQLAGTYGGLDGSGVVGNSYASVPSVPNIRAMLGSQAFAGTGFGRKPGIKLYGSSNAPNWSGWGNGRWGHYGKGK